MLILTAMSMMLLLAACGGSSDEPSSTATTAPPTAAPTTAATAVPTAVPTAAPTATAVPTAAPAPTVPAGSGDSDLIARGKVIFEETAGGIGCAFCHGLDGSGNGPANVGAPPNAGATEAMYREAQANGESGAMAFLMLANDEVEAVIAYLQVLGNQP